MHLLLYHHARILVVLPILHLLDLTVGEILGHFDSPYSPQGFYLRLFICFSSMRCTSVVFAVSNVLELFREATMGRI
jgi:hypothetical protein